MAGLKPLQLTRRRVYLNKGRETSSFGAAYYIIRPGEIRIRHEEEIGTSREIGAARAGSS